MIQTILRRSFSTQKMMFLFGAPGVGKGTYAEKLAKDLSLNHVSTGEEIRKILKGQTAAGFSEALKKEIQDIVTSGGFVDDKIVIDILSEKIKEPESRNGIIMDGIPRTLGQLDLYDKLGHPSHLVVNIFVNESVLLKRLLGRRGCSSCGKQFNIAEINEPGYPANQLTPEKIQPICEKTGGNHTLTQRADDTKDIITNRFKEYEEKTQPILDKFIARKIVVDFENKNFDDYPKLLKQCQDKLSKI